MSPAFLNGKLGTNYSLHFHANVLNRHLTKANTHFLCLEQAAKFCPCRNVSLRWQGLFEDRIIFLTLPGSAVQELFCLTMNYDQAKRLPPALWSNGHLHISRVFFSLLPLPTSQDRIFNEFGYRGPNFARPDTCDTCCCQTSRTVPHTLRKPRKAGRLPGLQVIKWSCNESCSSGVSTAKVRGCTQVQSGPTNSHSLHFEEHVTSRTKLGCHRLHVNITSGNLIRASPFV